MVGATTALFAAVVSLTQTDIKRTLAYSTISQLGFMTMLCGVGAFVAAIFHLIAHGFFKAFLFLSTGNSLAATHRHLEQHGKTSSVPAGGLFAGAAIISLLPALVFFSGSYRYLWLSQSSMAANIALWIVGLSTIFFTAIYLFSCVTTIFQDSPTGASDSDSGSNSPCDANPKVRISISVMTIVNKTTQLVQKLRARSRLSEEWNNI